MIRKIISMMVVVTILLGIVTTVSASETVNRTAGSTAYTSSKYKSNTSGTYYCYLIQASSGAFGDSNNKNIIHARIRRSSDLAKAGDMASFTATGQGGYYNYWYGFGDPRYYRLAVDDDRNLSFWVELNWWP